MARPLIVLALPAALAAACATGPADGSSKAQTGAEANRDSVTGVMAAPLRDVNVLRTKIPSVLLEAMADPYGRPEPATCEGITALLIPLDGALGADLDAPAQDEDDLLAHSREGALGVMAQVPPGWSLSGAGCASSPAPSAMSAWSKPPSAPGPCAGPI
jgi:hypothetical protein